MILLTESEILQASFWHRNLPNNVKITLNSLFFFFFFSPEIALQHVSMFFRSEPKWEVVEPLKDIGEKSMHAQKLALFFPMSCHNTVVAYKLCPARKLCDLVGL